MIPEYRQKETYLEGAYWCSTVMSLLDFDGTTKYVWNPYSLLQLKNKLGDFEAYLDCVASKNDVTCITPEDPIFKQQQISLLSVYQRCLSNYQSKTWDQGSFVMFNQSLQSKIRLNLVMPPGGVEDTFGVSKCLLEQKAQGNDNLGCLHDYFLKGSRDIDYFAYSELNQAPLSEMTDACLTFSGPSKSSEDRIKQPFKACLEDSVNRSGCDIPHMLWSGRSTNKVPIASQHALNISDTGERQRLAEGKMMAARDNVLRILEKIEREWTGDDLDITIFSADGDLFHQFADCVMQGPMGSSTLTPGPDGVEKVVWSRSSSGASTREFEIPCTGERLKFRDGVRDDLPPFTCGTQARRSVMKYFLRDKYGGTKSNPGAKNAVIQVVKDMINATREAWSDPRNLQCKCKDSSQTGWECCMQQTDCATEPCPCPEDGYEVKASVACCSSVCGGLAGSGIMAPFSYINGSEISNDLLATLGDYLKNDVWTSKDPWLNYDPLGADSYRNSWNQSSFDVTNAGLFDASNPVVYYDEIFYPFKSTFWEHCTGLLQQVIWTLPIDRATGKPRGMPSMYDPINGQSQSQNLTYIEDFIQTLTREAYKSSPVYWHYNVRHTPSQSEICSRSTPRMPTGGSAFQVAPGQTAPVFGLSSMTLGGLGGIDCYCGWWWSESPATCKIPDTLCSSMVQILGFSRICVTQKQLYNSSDHLAVIGAIKALKALQTTLSYPCPSLRISDHWGFFNSSTGQVLQNTEQVLLTEGASGFRVGNVDWIFDSQEQILNPSSRIEQPETITTNAALQCGANDPSSIADYFIDELFPSAQGVRQSMPQSYCARYGIELARLTVYTNAGLKDAASQQKGVVSIWRSRCQYKLEELAVCNSYKVYKATGASTDTSKCPFALSVAKGVDHAVSPGCLVVVWNAGQQDGIYDPCVCVPCTNTPNVDVPSQLTSICRLESFQLLVADDVVPGETREGVPLGSGSFRSLMEKPGVLRVNTPDIRHWALHTSMRDADLTLDWWPDEWKQPVGYHVTPGCSRPGDARWKTFDASWRWDSKLEQLIFAQEETNDPLLSRNAFGASGVCRTSNYGMPMTILNSMAVCTKENANAKADPMVPGNLGSAKWTDGQINCATDAFSTPWNVDKTTNPPRQWSVGTLQHEEALMPFTSTEWGSNCGPYPLQTCIVSSDCTSGLQCLYISGSSGVCGGIQSGRFECAAHAQCDNDKMCAGDGLCVEGVWQIKNSFNASVSFRSYSQACKTGYSLDTWGTSIAETLPDILNASGLCSYRSWFENRRMARRNQCENTDTCQSFSGARPWNFSDPSRKSDAGMSAFDSDVLTLKPHPCDRDYQFYDGFVSCTPRDGYALLFDEGGNVIQGAYAKDNRTITYRATGKRLPLIHHMDEEVGPTYGFTGVPQTYDQLKLGTDKPAIVPCASQKVCSFQPNFKVNNVQVDHRLVLENGVARGYTVGDLVKCGSFGFLLTSAATTTCQLDFAVAPLASFVISNQATLYAKQGFPTTFVRKGLSSSQYTPDNALTVLRVLQTLPDTLIKFYIGGPPDTLKDYVQKAGRFVSLYSALKKINKPVYDGGVVPSQLYNLTMYGAYEMPFAWWYRCGWLKGMDVKSIEDRVEDCTVTSGGNASQTTGFGNPDPRLARLFDIISSQDEPYQSTTLIQQLVQIQGIVTQTTLDQAYAEFIATRNAWIDRLSTKLHAAQRKCFTSKKFKEEYSRVSQQYQLDRVKQALGVSSGFPLTFNYTNDITKSRLCSGSECLQSMDYTIPTISNPDFSGMIRSALLKASIVTNSIPIEFEIPADTGKLTLNSLFSTTSVSSDFWTNLLQTFESRIDGCTQLVTLENSFENVCVCNSWDDCGAEIQKFMLKNAKIYDTPHKEIPPEVELGNDRVNACDNLANRCLLNTLETGVNFSTVQRVSTPVGIFAELYSEVGWECVNLSCTGAMSDLNGKSVPTKNIPTTFTRTVEKVVIEEYIFLQKIGSEKENGWSSINEKWSEISCDQYYLRYASITPNGNLYLSFSEPNGWKCTETCSVKERNVKTIIQVKMMARNISYYKDNVLVSQFETMPCVFSGSAKQINFDGTVVTALPDFYLTLLSNAIKAENAYRLSPATLSDATQNLLPICETSHSDENGMPLIPPGDKARVNLKEESTEKMGTFGTPEFVAPLPPPNTRYYDGRSTPSVWNYNPYRSSYSTYTPSGAVVVPEMDRIRNITLTINSDCDGQTSCSKSMPQRTVSYTTREFNDQKRRSKCTDLKGDPFLGCVMWPGEKTQKCYASSSDDNYHCFVGHLTDRTFQAPMYNRCMQDSSLDPCKSSSPTEMYRTGSVSTTYAEGVFRDMQLTGKTHTYTITTINPDCTAGPVHSCRILDERDAWQQDLYACPGTNSSAARYKGRANVAQSGLAHTQIALMTSPVTNTTPVDGFTYGFGHMFIGTEPGYQCGTSSCGKNKIPVQMLRNLYACVDCPIVTAAQCTGTHGCKITSPKIEEGKLNSFPGWNNLTAAQSAFLTKTDSAIEIAAPAVKWLAEQVTNLWTSGTYLPYELPEFMTSFKGKYEYNPTAIVAFDAAMQINAQTCTETGTMPDFTNCSYDSHRRDLRNFAQTYYKTSDGIIIQPGQTLQWRLGRAQMTSQNIPQWESTANRTGLFLNYLFDDKWCRKGSMTGNACLVTVDGEGRPDIQVLNPGLLGAFEPSVGCDTAIINNQRVTYAYCDDCEKQEEFTEVESDGDGNPSYMRCSSNFDAVQRVTANLEAPSNLCRKTPYDLEGVPYACANMHGTLNGDGSAVKDLYDRLPWNGGQPTGIGQNPFLRGTAPSSSANNLAISPKDIGGHYIRMTLAATRSGAYALSVQGMPLSSYAGSLSSEAYGLGVSSSSPKWTLINTAMEAYNLATKYPASVCAQWDCPLRRRAFYMGIDQNFRPVVPDPLRTQILYGTRSHPTQATFPMPSFIDKTSNPILGVYRTSNGFCACMSPPCKAKCAQDTASLYGAWSTATTATGESQCTEQLDWPYAGGTMRDGSAFSQRWKTQTPCGILDRLPAFQYTYANLKATIPSAKTTLDRGGVCHMGWPVVTAGPLAGCYLLVDTESFMCPSFLQPKKVTRLRAKTVSELLGSTSRPRLTDCNPPPTYATGNGKTLNSEVSYGMLKRWEASRLLANDLRRRLCGNRKVCEPAKEWSLPTFWSNVFMASFPSVPTGNGQNASLWAEPWVACVQNKTDNTQTCDGIIPRDQWATGDRPTLCREAATSSPLASKLVQNVNVCDLDSTLDLFCRTIQDARYQVFEANCLYSGVCRQKLFFYQPSTYEINNGEFVRNTVQTFYNSSVSGACVPDQDTAAAIRANADNLKNCAAMKLNVLVDCIQIIRVIVESLVEIAFYCWTVWLNLFELLGANEHDKQQIITQINALLALIKNKAIILFQEIGDLFYKILFDGPMGEWLITLIKAVCKFIEYLFSEIVYVVLCWTRSVSVWFLENVAKPFVDVLNGISLNRLGYLYSGISDAVNAIEENIPCTKKDLWSCNIEFEDDNDTNAILPMPTRCWAGVQPEVGGSLGCSAADTCMQTSDYSHIICGSCPLASSMTRFGCDTLTKLCTCNVFPVGISSCASHEECTMDEDVSCQYVDSYLQPSYGNVPCTQCPKPMCLITGGSSGQCSCLLRPVPSQTCTGVGQLVSPDAGKLCLVTTAGSSQSTSNSYSVDYRMLASVPCMLLNQARSFCMSVFSQGVSTQLVVGDSLLSTRRRRLLMMAEDFAIVFNSTPWEGKGEPCRALANANNIDNLGILESYTLGECWRWYQIGVRLTIEANMTGIVSPYLLVSWRDMLDTLLDKRALVEVMAKLPSVLHRLFLHSEFAQPVYIVVAYWSAVLPKGVWENQTMLNKIKERIVNSSTGMPVVNPYHYENYSIGSTGRRLLQKESESTTGNQTEKRAAERRLFLQQQVIKDTVSSQTAYEWSQGPYSWPPNFKYWKGEQSCAAVSTAIDVIRNGLDATIKFYKNPLPQSLPVAWPDHPFLMPDLSKMDFSSSSEFVTTTDVESITDASVHALSKFSDTWLDKEKIKKFLTKAPYMSMLKSIIQCNFTQIQTCEGRQTLPGSVLQTIIVVILLAVLLKFFQIPYAELILAILFTPAILYFAYGYSPTCAPLVPTCFLSDLISLLDSLIPESIVWPPALVTTPGCSEANCIRNCATDPVVGFSSIYDHPAWVICEVMGSEWSTNTAARGNFYPAQLNLAVIRKCGIDTDTAQRICFAFTLFNRMVPLIFLILLIMWIIPSILGAAAALAQMAANVVFAFVLFVHSQHSDE